MIFLNDRWRVRLNDPTQWILEYRAGRPAGAGDGWRGKSYCTQRDTLLRDIRERIIDEGGEVAKFKAGWHVITHPGSMKGLLALGQIAKKACANLTDFTARFIQNC